MFYYCIDWIDFGECMFHQQNGADADFFAATNGEKNTKWKVDDMIGNQRIMTRSIETHCDRL